MEVIATMLRTGAAGVDIPGSWIAGAVCAGATGVGAQDALSGALLHFIYMVRFWNCTFNYPPVNFVLGPTFFRAQNDD